jgi:hypothetical protein
MEPAVEWKGTWSPINTSYFYGSPGPLSISDGAGLYMDVGLDGTILKGGIVTVPRISQVHNIKRWLNIAT